MKKHYAAIDTNVLVSSLLSKHSNAATRLVVDAIVTGEIIPLYNEEILSEYKAVLSRDKFPFSEGKIEVMLNIIKNYGVNVSPSPTGVILPDMDDLVFYEVVMEKRNEDSYLITGNIKHFPARSFIVTPAEMVAILAGKK